MINNTQVIILIRKHFGHMITFFGYISRSKISGTKGKHIFQTLVDFAHLLFGKSDNLCSSKQQSLGVTFYFIVPSLAKAYS